MKNLNFLRKEPILNIDYEMIIKLVKRRNILLILLLILLTYGKSLAIDYTTTGSGAWTDPIWAPGGTPGASDNVTIDVGHNLTLPSGVTVTNLTINGSLDQSGQSLQVDGTIAGNGTLTSSNSALILNGVLNFSGTFTTNSSTSLTIGNAGAYTTFSSITGGLGTFVLSRNFVFPLQAGLTISSSCTVNSGTLNLNNQTLQVDGNISGAGTIDASNSSLLLNGAVNFSGAFTSDLTSTLNISGAGAITAFSTFNQLNSLILNRAGQTLALGGALEVNTLTVNNGTLNLSSNSLEVNTNCTSTGTINADNSSVQFDGIINITGTFDVNASTNVSVLNAGAITAFPSIDQINNLVLNRVGETLSLVSNAIANDVTVTAGTLNLNSRSLEVNGSLTGAGTLNADNSSLQLDGAINFAGTFTSNTSTSLTIANAGVITAFPNIDELSTLVMNRGGQTLNLGQNLLLTTFTLTSGTVDLNTFNIEIDGAFTGSGTLDADDSDVQFDGAINFGGTFTSNSATNLSVLNAGAITTFPSIDNLNSLTINRAGQTFTLTGNLVLNDLTLSAGTLSQNSNSIQVDGTISGAAGALNSSNSTLTLNGAINFGGTFTSNTSTNLTIANAGLYTAFPSITGNLNNFVLSRAITFPLQANLQTSGNCTVSAGTLDANGNTLRVDGTLSGGASIDITGTSTLRLQSAVDFSNFTLLSDNTSSLDFQSGGAISNFPGISDLNNLTLSRNAITLTLPQALHVHSVLTLSSGTISTEYNLEVDGAATINGTLNYNHALAGARSLTFDGTLSGTGTINAEPTANNLAFYINGAYSFTNASGAINTNSAVSIYVGGATGNNFTLDAGVDALRGITINSNPARAVGLSADLSLGSGGVNFLNNASNELQVNAFVLSINATYAPAAIGGILDATGNGTVNFLQIADFTNGTLQTDCTTTLNFDADVSAYPTGANNLYDLSIDGVFAFPAADFTICNSITITATATVTTAANRSISITNNLTMNGIFNASNITSLSIGGAISTIVAATWNTTANIDLTVNGTASSLSLPVEITSLRRITLSRPNGMTINANLTLGEDAASLAYSGYVLYISSGDFDLNGYNTTLAHPVNRIYETPSGGQIVVNTGGDGAYITTATAGSTRDEIINSGIGIYELLGEPDNLTVKRFPKSKVIPNYSATVARYYQISFTIGGPIARIKFEYDNTELNGNVATDLKIYEATDDLFKFDLDSADLNENYPGNAKGITRGIRNGFTGYTDKYYALMSNEAIKISLFNNTGGDNRWANPNNWSPVGVPDSTSDVVIGDYTVYLDGRQATYKCNQLYLTERLSKLVPATGSTSGDTVHLYVGGSITLAYPGSFLNAVNGYGRINIYLGHRTHLIESVITPIQNYSSTAGICFYNLTLKKVHTTFAGDFDIRIMGDLKLTESATFSPYTSGNGTLIVWGGAKEQINFTTDAISQIDLVNFTIGNNANISSNANITVREEMRLTSIYDQFIATGKTLTFQPEGSVNGWEVPTGAIFKPYNVSILNVGNTDITPIGTIQVQGDFTYSNGGGANTGSFLPQGDYVKFVGPSTKFLENQADYDEMRFYNIEIAQEANVQTSSSFQVKGNFILRRYCGFSADSGTIYFIDDTVPSVIVNENDR